MKGSILFLTIDFPPMNGGMARHSYDIAVALKKAGELPVVMTHGTPCDIDFDSNSDLSILRLRKINPAKIFDSYIRSFFIFFSHAFYYCLTHKVEIIMANTWSIGGIAAFLLKKICGVPYFVFAHGLDVYQPQNNRKVEKIMKLVLSNASLVIINSHFTKGLLDRIMTVKSIVLHPAVDIERFTKKNNIPKKFENRRILLTVARLVESKGHDFVLRSLNKVIRDYPELLYCIVGTGGTENYLKTIVRENGLTDNVFFAGNADEDELMSYYHSCDIFIMTSQEIPALGEVEGFGIVFLEAGACGKPVIGSKSGGIIDAIIDGVTGILVAPSDIDEIAGAIIKLLSNKDLSNKLGENGQKRVELEFNTNKLAKKLKKAISEND